MSDVKDAVEVAEKDELTTVETTEATGEKKTIIFHLGTPGTGTSSLQCFLSANNQKLRDQGFFYPIGGRNFHDHSTDTTVYVNGSGLNNQAYLEYYIGMVRAMANTDAHTMIFSEEEIFENLSAFVERMGKAVDETKFNYKVVLYMKHSARYIVDQWKDGVRGEKLLTDSLEDFVQTYDYTKALKGVLELIELFGKDNVILRPFEPNHWIKGNLISDFMNIIDAEITEDLDLENVNINRGIGRLVAERHRYLNRLCPAQFQSHDGARKVAQMKKNLIEEVESDMAVIDSLPDTLIKSICDRYAELERQIAQDLLGQDQLFSTTYPAAYESERATFGILSKEERDALMPLSHVILMNVIADGQHAIVRSMNRRY